MTGLPCQTICTVLGVGRATAYRATVGRPRRYVRAGDATVLAQIRAILRTRGSYGYRRVTVLVNRTFGTRYNRKRIQRLMQVHRLGVPRRRYRVRCQEFVKLSLGFFLGVFLRTGLSRAATDSSEHHSTDHTSCDDGCPAGRCLGKRVAGDRRARVFIEPTRTNLAVRQSLFIAGLDWKCHWIVE